MGNVPLEVYPLSESPSSFCTVVMPQAVGKGMLPYCRQPWNLITSHVRFLGLVVVMPSATEKCVTNSCRQFAYYVIICFMM